MVAAVQSLSCVWLFSTPWTQAHQASLSLTISQNLPKFISIALVMSFSHLILWRPLPLLPSMFFSIRDFSSESALSIRWPKYWSFIFSISPSSEYSGFISLKIDWFDLLAVQGTLRSLLQHHRLKASILRHSAFFMALETVCDHWEDQSLDYKNLCQQSNVSAFQHTLGLSLLSCQEANVFWFLGCSHHPQWFWSPRSGNPSLLSPFPPLFAMAMGWMAWS